MRVLTSLPTLFATILSIFWLATPAQGQGDGDDAWSTLAAVRDSVTEAGPMAADFVQTFVPAGFSTGETETGVLAVDLPDCLRFDYEEPYPKSFLLCGETARYWNREDRTGRRYAVDRQEEPGLDLVLLGLEPLRERYRVESREPGDHRVVITLEAREEKGDLRSATFVVDPQAKRLTGLSYEDREGNVTRFEISDYRPLKDPDRFEPPTGIDWREQ